jgi:hypothetical protein
MQRLYSLAAVLGLLVVPSPSVAWNVTPHTEGFSTLATLGMRMNDGTRVHLIVDYDVRLRCQPSIGFMEFKGQKLGTRIQQPYRRGSLKLTAGAQSETVVPIVVQYSNGVERFQNFRPAMLEKIKTSSPIVVTVDGARSYELPPLIGSSALLSAQRACLSSSR